jgi:titin
MLPNFPRTRWRLRLSASRAHDAGPPGRLPGSTLGLETLEDRAVPSTFTVTNTNVLGPGSLRQAILDANADTPPSLIRFNIPGTGVHTIRPGSVLPPLTGAVVIDGTTQQDYSGSPLIEINGLGVSGREVSGLTLQGGNSRITGLIINRFFDGPAILLTGPGGDTITGNYLGTDATGTQALGNAVGLAILNSNNTIGGTRSADANLIAGNTGSLGNLGQGNVFLSGVSGNVILGNKIGTDITGTKALGNASYGDIGLNVDSCSNTTIGGSAAGAGNLISGNLRKGVRIGTSGGIVVLGNKIGTDASGSNALGNQFGIAVEGSAGSGNTLGGTATGAGNLISGNTQEGVILFGARNTVIQGNRIGTDSTGSKALGNASDGMFLGEDCTDNTIGGAASGAGNLISGNGQSSITARLDTRTVIQGNQLGTDAAGAVGLGSTEGIDLIQSTGDTIGGTATGAGNLISNNADTGILLESSGGTLIQGNQIGTDAAGKAALGNGTGISVDQNASLPYGSNNVVISGNLISGNPNFGIYVNPVSFGTLVQGNTIGTDVSGSAALPNGIGVLLQSDNNTVGGTATGAGNLISGNSTGGVFLGSCNGNLIQGNKIGTDRAGKAALPNATGVYILNGTNTTVGGTTAGSGNLISGNLYNGISVDGANSAGNLIQGNFIGTDSSGTAMLGNGGNGVAIVGTAYNNLVGGSAAGANNVIAFNGSYGVLVDGGLGNAILHNSLFGNGLPGGGGIGLFDGGNNSQPAPTLTSAASSGGSTTVQGTLSGLASTSYTIELFANSDATDGEGRQFLGSYTVTTDDSGNVSFSLNVSMAVPSGWTVTATATDPWNDTSAFSAPQAVTP